MVFATIAAISGFVAAAIESTSSGADPVSSATIESYASITELHKRIGNIEDILLDIHKTLGIQPGQLDQALAVRSALDSEIRVWASLQEQRSDRNGMLAQLRAGKSKDEVWLDYVQISQQNAKNLSVNTFNLIETGPFSMEIALVGIAAEAGILAEAGTEPEVVVSRITDKLERIEEKLELHVAPLILDASERLENSRQEIDDYVGSDDWMMGGEFLSGKNSIAYTLTGLFFAACYDIVVMDGSVSGGTARYRLPGGNSRRYDASSLWDIHTKTDGAMCGQSEIDISQRNGRGSLKNLLDAYGISLTENLPLERFGDWRGGLERRLNDYNLKADYLDILIGYDATIRYGVDELERNARVIARSGANSEMASLGAALDAVHAEFTGKGVWQVIEAERRIDTSLAEAFRQNFSDVAAGIDARVDAGLSRHAAVITAYEKDKETLAIAGYFKALATIAGAVDTLQEISSPEQKDDPESSPDVGAEGGAIDEPAQTTVEPPGKAETAGSDTLVPGPVREVAGEMDPVTDQLDNAETRAKRIEAIITELKLLGPPTGKAENSGITRQEKLVFEATALLDLWEMTAADKAYLASSSDAIESMADISLKVGSGDLRGALIDIVIDTFKPTMIGDMGLLSIAQAKNYAKQLEPHVEAMVRWRIPVRPSAQEVINHMILSNQSYPKMEAK